MNPDAPEPLRLNGRFAVAVLALLACALAGPIAGLQLAEAQAGSWRTWVLLAALVPCAGLALVTFFAWRLGWARRTGFVFCAVLFAGGDVLTVTQLQDLRERSQGKAVLSTLRRLSSAIDQFFLEQPEKLFVTYADLVGVDRYLKGADSVAGEDYRPLFPRRRDDPVAMLVVMPRGNRVTYASDFPVPADGPDTQRLRDGSHVETTYRGGRAQGAFRWKGNDGIVRATGTLADGWPQGPIPILDRDGRTLRQETYPRPRVFVGPNDAIDLSGAWSLQCLTPSSIVPTSREIHVWDMQIRDEAGQLTAELKSREGRTQRLTGTRRARVVEFTSPLPGRVEALTGSLQADNFTLRDAKGDWVARPLQ